MLNVIVPLIIVISMLWFVFAWINFTCDYLFGKNEYINALWLAIIIVVTFSGIIGSFITVIGFAEGRFAI